MIVGTFYDLDREGRLHGYSRSDDGFVPIQPGVNTSRRGWEVITIGEDPCYYWGSMPNHDDVDRTSPDFDVRAVIEATGEVTDRTAETIRVLGIVDPMAQLETRWSRFALRMGRERNFVLALVALGLLGFALVVPFVLLFPDVTPTLWFMAIIGVMFHGGQVLIRASLHGQGLYDARGPKGLPERVAKFVELYPDVTVHPTEADLTATYPPTIFPERRTRSLKVPFPGEGSDGVNAPMRAGVSK